MPKKRENGEGGICYEKDRDKYRAYIYDPEGNRLRERFDTREEAQNWLDELKAQFKRNEYVVPNDITLSQWIVRWLKTYKTEIRDKTKLQYLWAFSHIEPIANMQLQDKNAHIIIQEFLNGLADILAPNSRWKIYQLIAAATKKAHLLRLISNNFMELVEAPKREQQEIEIFTSNEMTAIFAYLQAPDTPEVLSRHYQLMMLLATTGARPGEILALKWKNVNFAEEKIKIETTILALPKVGIVEAPPKTKAGIREITLPPHMCQILKGLRGNGKIMYMCRSDDYVFHTAHGTAFFPSNIRRDWKKILAGAGVEYKSLKTWRHTHATQLLAKGVPLLEVSKRLGHSKPSHTLNLYGHAIPDFDKNIALKVAEIYGIAI